MFVKLADLPMWRCWRSARTYSGDGIKLYLFKIFGGIWLCAHGPEHIDNARQFQAAQFAGTLAPVWGSQDNVTDKGSHCWDSFNSETRRWVGETGCYYTAVLE